LRGRPAVPPGAPGPRCIATTNSMTRPSRSDAALAGLMLVVTMVLCAGAGLALGALVGLPVPFVLAGLFVGLAVGFALVYARFKDI
jgi:hypothetical protein